jgi:hypothetical protein
MSFLELHDARGSVPRGQNVQFDKSPSSMLEDFSAEDGRTPGPRIMCRCSNQTGAWSGAG